MQKLLFEYIEKHRVIIEKTKDENGKDTINVFVPAEQEQNFKLFHTVNLASLPSAPDVYSKNYNELVCKNLNRLDYFWRVRIIEIQ